MKLSSKLMRNSNSNSTILSTPVSSMSSSPSSTPAQSPSASPTARAPSPSSARPSARAPPPPPARPSAQTRPPQGRTSPTPSSPPGFPIKPQYQSAHLRYPGLFKTNKRPEISVSLVSLPDPNPSILDANIYALRKAFNDADVQLTTNQQLRALLKIDPEGRVEPGINNATTFKTSQGLVYEFGHGRSRCVPDQCMLRTQDEMPNNCGFHNQFYRPYNFQICGSSCAGSLCKCLQYY